jgi:pimeloyl-ACP methyl ester carboxylesterase
VHGVGFDSSYWHFQGSGVDPSYSYARQAAAEGYTTFRYDRLGTGQSDHPADAYNVVQAATDVRRGVSVEKLKLTFSQRLPSWKRSPLAFVMAH